VNTTFVFLAFQVVFLTFSIRHILSYLTLFYSVKPKCDILNSLQCDILNSLAFLTFQFEHLPWSDILRSPAVWAIIFGHFGACWGYYTLFTGMPTYFKDVLDFDIEQVSFEYKPNIRPYA